LVPPRRSSDLTHLESLQLPGTGFAGTTEVDGHYIETTAGGMLGEASIETLGHTGTPGHQQVAQSAARRMIAIDAQRVAAACEQAELFRADVAGGGCCGHDGLRTAVSCWNQGSGMTADKARARCAFQTAV